MEELKNKTYVVLITGASCGIGRAMAKAFYENGYKLITIDKKDPINILKDEVFFKVDLLNEKELKDIVNRIKSNYKVDVLINNAGLVIPERSECVSLDSFKRTMQLNTEVPLRLMQAVVAGMKDRNYGRIINITSRAVLGKELRTSYAASKGAVIAMARTWALELGEFGITVNNIAPGPIQTEMFMQNNSNEKIQKIKSQLPVKKLGMPIEIAHAALYLADKRSSFITGQNIYLCGGLTIGLSSF